MDPHLPELDPVRQSLGEEMDVYTKLKSINKAVHGMTGVLLGVLVRMVPLVDTDVLIGALLYRICLNSAALFKIHMMHVVRRTDVT